MRKQSLQTGAAARLVLQAAPRLVAILGCALMNACGSTNPSSGGLDGQWSGTTSQGTPITFAVSSAQKVTDITIGYNFNGCSGVQTYSNLSLDTAPMVTCIPGPCPGAVSSYRAFSYLDGSIGGPVTAVNGLFLPTNRAEGQVAFRDYPGCGTMVGVGWTANRR
jgi:hypothetical protein